MAGSCGYADAVSGRIRGACGAGTLRVPAVRLRGRARGALRASRAGAFRVRGGFASGRCGPRAGASCTRSVRLVFEPRRGLNTNLVLPSCECLHGGPGGARIGAGTRSRGGPGGVPEVEWLVPQDGCVEVAVSMPGVASRTGSLVGSSRSRCDNSSWACTGTGVMLGMSTSSGHRTRDADATWRRARGSETDTSRTGSDPPNAPLQIVNIHPGNAQPNRRPNPLRGATPKGT